MTTVKYIGIDVGLTGAIACIQDHNPEVWDMPVLKTDGKKKLCEVELEILLNHILSGGLCYVMVEKQQVMPQQGAVSGYTLGYQEGVVAGILTAYHVSYQRIRPRAWQKSFDTKTADKISAWKLASKLFPSIALVTPRGRILDGRCDALLIAEHCRRAGMPENN